MQIKVVFVCGRWINLEIARMNDHPQRRMNGQSHAVHQTVRHANRVNREGPDFHPLTGLNLVQHRVAEVLVFFELLFHVCECEFRSVNRNIQLGKNPRQPADVVLVRMGEKYPANVLAVLDQVRNIGDDDINAKQFGFREHQARINDDNVIAIAHSHAVHAELAESAKWD